MSTFFITGTGTGVGKTVFTCALTHAFRAQNKSVAALKPIETGCTPEPEDAILLAEASAQPALAFEKEFYRAAPALSPYAVSLATQAAAPDLEMLVARVHAISSRFDVTLVEGAGGLLVPVDRKKTMADFAMLLGYPLIVVAKDELGVLSHTLAVVEAARARKLTIAAIVLSVHASHSLSTSNAFILQERTQIPTLHFSTTAQTPQEFVRAIQTCGVLPHIINH